MCIGMCIETWQGCPKQAAPGKLLAFPLLFGASLKIGALIGGASGYVSYEVVVDN